SDGIRPAARQKPTFPSVQCAPRLTAMPFAVDDASVAAPGKISVSPIAGALGAEIAGVNLADELDDGVVAEIRRAWLAHLVVFCRDRPLEGDRFMAFARGSGAPVESPFARGLDTHPRIIAGRKLPPETANFGGICPSAPASLAEPPMATLLLAREIPPVGGD